MYVAGNNVTYHRYSCKVPDVTLQRKNIRLLVSYFRLKFCYIEHNDRSVVAQFLSVSIKCWYKTFGDIRRNY